MVLYIDISAVLAAGGMIGVGEFEQFDGRAVFDDERDADPLGWAVGRNQDFAAGEFGGEIRHFKRDVPNLTCGTWRTRSGTAASASKRIHSTPNSLFSWLTMKSFRWVSPGFDSVVGIPM
jgi:hypothetical protein